METLAIYLLIFPVEFTNTVDLCIAMTAVKQLSQSEEFDFVPFQEYPYHQQSFTEFLQKNNESWDRVRDYPKCIDGLRFGPDYQSALLMRVHYSREKDNAMALRTLHQDRSTQFDKFIDEYHWKYRCWDALEDSLSKHGTFEFKRRRLNDLKELLGEEMWAKAEMP